MILSWLNTDLKPFLEAQARCRASAERRKGSLDIVSTTLQATKIVSLEMFNQVHTAFSSSV